MQTASDEDLHGNLNPFYVEFQKQNIIIIKHKGKQ